MTYEDRPTPGFGHLLYQTAAAGIFFALAYYFLKREDLPERTFQYVLAGLILVTVLFLAWSFYGSFRTVYRLDEEKLEVRRGRSVKTVVLENIEAILLVGFNWSSLGLSLRPRDYCNRLTDGIRLTTSAGKFHISPTNPRLYANHIRTMRFAGPPLPEFPPDEPVVSAGEGT